MTHQFEKWHNKVWNYKIPNRVFLFKLSPALQVALDVDIPLLESGIHWPKKKKSAVPNSGIPFKAKSCMYPMLESDPSHHNNVGGV